MLSRIESSDVFFRFMNVYRKHNDQCPEYTTFRTCKTTGRVTEFTRQRGVISESVKTTFYMILTEYVESYVSVATSEAAILYFDSDPPSLLTNSVRLSFKCDCSSRTIRNHLTKLRNLGVIQTKFRGREHDYELRIGPEFLYGGEGEGNLKKREIRPKIDIPSNNMKIFPANKSYRELNEIEKGNVDMFISDGERDGEIDGEEEPADSSPKPTPETVQQAEKNEAGGPPPILSRAEIVAENNRKRLERASTVLEGKILKGPRGLETKYLNLLLDFWHYAYKVLYPDKDFTMEQKEKALVAIMAGVYNNFSDERTEKQWVDFQILQLSKLDKAGKYYDHHPEQWAPDPYAFAIPGKGYFDAENQKGFVVIDAWIKKDLWQKAENKSARDDEKAKKEKQCREILRKCRVDLERLRAGLVLRKETRGKDIKGIYLYYHKQLHYLGKTYSDQLDVQFQDQQLRGFAMPKYDKAKRLRKAASINLKKEPTPATLVYTESWMEGDGQGYYVED